jgi:hypothetical protein
MNVLCFLVVVLLVVIRRRPVVENQYFQSVDGQLFDLALQKVLNEEDLKGNIFRQGNEKKKTVVVRKKVLPEQTPLNIDVEKMEEKDGSGSDSSWETIYQTSEDDLSDTAALPEVSKTDSMESISLNSWEVNEQV